MAVIHYFLSPLLVAHGFIPILLSNLLYMVAGSYYHYLNFLGYDGKLNLLFLFFRFQSFFSVLCFFFFYFLPYFLLGRKGTRPRAGVGEYTMNIWFQMVLHVIGVITMNRSQCLIRCLFEHSEIVLELSTKTVLCLY